MTLQSFVAEDAGAVGVRERHDDEIAGFHAANVGPDGFDDADGLVSHASAGIAVFHCLVRPEIAAADAGAADDYDRVSRLDDTGVGNGLDTNVAGAEHYSCAHNDLPLVSGGLDGPVLFVADLFHPLDALPSSCS